MPSKGAGIKRIVLSNTRMELADTPITAIEHHRQPDQAKVGGQRRTDGFPANVRRAICDGEHHDVHHAEAGHDQAFEGGALLSLMDMAVRRRGEWMLDVTISLRPSSARSG